MKPKINLCIYNHVKHGILDQIWFVQQVFLQHGYELACSQTLRPDCLNILIENFIEQDIETYDAFCRTFGKQIGIIMTEHLELEKGGFSFNGAPLKDQEYIANKEQRLFSLLSLAEHIFGLFTLGELPELRTWRTILPSCSVHRLPYPAIQQGRRDPATYDHDIVFTGAMTSYREAVLKKIARKYRVVRTASEATEEERTALYASAKIALNIPQTPDWQWISPMRVLFGLRVGVPTLHFGHRDATLLSKLVLEPVDIDVAVRDHEAFLARQATSYASFVRSNYNSPFPESLFQAWGDMELDR